MFKMIGEARKPLVFIDNSGSTSGSTDYWRIVEIIVRSNEDAKFFLWNSSCAESSFDAATKNCSDRRGGGGTEPESILRFLSEGDSICLITDGEVSPSSVHRCVGRVPNLSHVHYACIGRSANLSVGAPFTDVANQYEVSYNGNLLTKGSGTADIDLEIANPDDFLAQADELMKAVTMQCLVGPKPNLRARLVALSGKMQAMCAADNSKQSRGPMEDLKNIIDRFIGREVPLAATDEASESTVVRAPSESELIDSLKAVVTPVGTDESKGARVQRIFNELFKKCDSSGNFALDQLLSRVDRAPAVAAVPITGLPLADVDCSGQFECPVGMFSDAPVLYIREGPAIFAEWSKQEMEYYLNNPMAVLTNNDLVGRMRERIDGVFGFTMAQQCFNMGDHRSPLSRAPIVGFISSIVDPEHAKATNYAVANLFFGGKLVGCADIWLAVVLLACEQVPYVAERADALEQFQSMLRTRMRTSKTNMTLSGLPILPQMRCRTDVAVFHCLWSPFVPLVDNRVRYFGRSTVHWIRLAKLLQLPTREEDLLNLMEYYECFGWMMREEKDNKPWRNVLRARYQNHTVLSNGTIIFLDEFVPSPSFPVCTTVTKSFTGIYPGHGLSTGVLLALAARVDRTKPAAAIEIPYPLAPEQIPAPVINYPHYEYGKTKDIPICPATLRPYIVDKSTGKPWQESAIQLAGPILGQGHQLSVNKYMYEYVVSKNAFPGPEELCEFMSGRESRREQFAVNTLPLEVMRFISELFSSYFDLPGVGNAFCNISVKEFLEVMNKSCSLEMRAAMEEEG